MYNTLLTNRKSLVKLSLVQPRPSTSVDPVCMDAVIRGSCSVLQAQASGPSTAKKSFPDWEINTSVGLLLIHSGNKSFELPIAYNR